MSSTSPSLKQYVAISPEGRVVEIPKWVFDGLCEMIDNKTFGSFVIHFNSGGFCSAEMKKLIKSQNGNGGSHS